MAIAIWLYIPLKLFVFDPDVALVGALAPDARWLLSYRLLILLSLVAIAWFSLGHERFFGAFAYTTGYPFVVLLWHAPRLLWKRWPLLIVFAPTIHAAARWFRVTLATYIAAAFAVAVIANQHDSRYLVPSMLVLALLLVIRLYRAIREAPGSSVFAEMTSMVRRLREKIEGGSLDALPGDATDSAGPQLDPKTFPPLYMCHCAAAYVAKRVESVAQGRGFNTVLVFDWLHAFAVAISVFALEYWALFRIAPLSFSHTNGDGALQFFIYSLTIFTSSSISPISAVTTTAQVIAALEVLCAILLLISGCFSIFTARRDSYREDLRLFNGELGDVATAVEARIVTVYRLSAEAMEHLLVTHNEVIVNFLRKGRGLPELTPGPQVIEATATVVVKPEPESKPE